MLYWLELQLAAHVFLAGAFTYWLLRRLNLGRAPAMVGATVYQLGAYMASQTEHLGAIDAAAWLPLAWLCVIALGERFQWRWLAGLACALAMSILAGFPATTAVVFISCFLLAAILALLRRASPLALVQHGDRGMWAMLLAAIQVFPTLQLSRLSVAQYRSSLSEHRRRYATAGSGLAGAAQSLRDFPIRWRHVEASLASDFSLYLLRNSGARVCGIGARRIAGTATRRAIALLTLCAAFWMLGDSTPVGRTVFVLLPDSVKGSLYAEFALCAFSLGMALLAGLGARPSSSTDAGAGCRRRVVDDRGGRPDRSQFGAALQYRR